MRSAPNSSTCGNRGSDLAPHRRIVAGNAGEIHYFAEANNIRPSHRFCDIFGVKRRSGMFQSRCGRYTRRHLDINVDGLGHRFIMHQADTVQSKHIGNLVGINEHRGRAMGDHGAAKFGNRHHAAFNMHVGVTQSGDQISAAGIDNPSVFTDHRAGIRTAIGKPALDNRQIGTGNDLA